MDKELLTCGDNSCHLDKPEGMGTNGGCRCLKDLPTAQKLRVQKYIYREKRKVQELEAKLKRLSQQVKDYLDGTKKIVEENGRLRKDLAIAEMDGIHARTQLLKNGKEV